MPSLARAAIVVLGAMSLGSWVGLGQPDAAQAAPIVVQVRAVASHLGIMDASSSGPDRGVAGGLAGGAAAGGLAGGAVADDEAGAAETRASSGPRGGAADGAAPMRPRIARRGGAAHAPSPKRVKRRDPDEIVPMPHHSEPELVGGLTPWPMLNPEASPARAWMVAEGPAYAADDKRRLVTLTFDDGPSPDTTPLVLRALARRRVRATFFVIGSYLDGDTPRVRACRRTLERVAAAGHLIGNHTYEHARLTSSAISHTQVLDQIDRSAESIERVTGKRPILFRPPFGQLDELGQAAVRARGLDMIFWSIDKQDMIRGDARGIFRELVGQIEYKEGGIVLLHDIRKTSVEALEHLLAWLDEHRYDPSRPDEIGYEIVDLPTYLRAVAESPLPFADRDELEAHRRAIREARP